MNRKDYHADPCETPSLNASTAKVLLSESPLHAWMQHPKLNPNYQPDTDIKYDIGSAAHALLLEGEDKLVIIEADDYRTKDAKAKRMIALAEDNTPVLAKDEADLRAMVEAARVKFAESPDLKGYSLAEGDAEHTMIWKAKNATIQGTYAGDEEPMRGRLDWISKDRRLIIDYKTTTASANPNRWIRTALDHGADIQAAFYLWGNLAVNGVEDAKFVFLVQETTAPYCCSFVGVGPMMRDLGDWKVIKAVELWSKCLKSNEWPGYPSRIVWPDPPAWSMAEMEAE